MTATDPGSQQAAYSATSRAWQQGPGRIYDRLAETVVAACPVPVAGRLVLDLGTGTGAAARALLRSGAAVVAVDNAVGMLLTLAGPAAGGDPGSGGDGPIPGAAGDALALPFRAGAFGAVVASFCLNHLSDPAAGMAEAARVTQAGGAVVASAYAEDDDHPVKAAVEQAVTEAGWVPAPWYRQVKADAMPKLATAERMAEVAAGVPGLVDLRATRHEIPFPDLGPGELVEWRLGMAQIAPFFATLPSAEQAAVCAAALERLGEHPPPLVRRVVILTALVARPAPPAG
jgi:ubiquinone/menaquinone biosynthesis C-methylase UbiE